MGYIKLDRKILEWEWWDDINTYRLFTYCLLRANWKESKYHGVDIPRGGFVTSLASLSKATGLSIQQVRTSLEHLISTGEVTRLQQGKFSVVVVNNYTQYQDDNTVDNKEVTSYQQDDNRVITTEEEYKEEKEEEEINTLSRGDVEQERTSPTDDSGGEVKQKRFVPPSVEEVDAYCQERHNGISGSEFCDFYESKGWMVGKTKMKNWKSAVRTWEHKRGYSYNPTQKTTKETEQSVVHTRYGDYEVVTLDDM